MKIVKIIRELGFQIVLKYIPRTIKIIIFQLILVVIGYFWLKGKHFGKTIPLYEEIERLKMNICSQWPIFIIKRSVQT